MSRAAKTICLFLAGFSLLLVLLSFSAWLLHWRVDNEPGARPIPVLLLAHRLLLSAGTAGVLLFPCLIVHYRARPYLHLLFPMSAALLVYAPLLLLTLVMLV
jgi:hypothetical protein